jgi:hypothetical protein
MHAALLLGWRWCVGGRQGFQGAEVIVSFEASPRAWLEGRGGSCLPHAARRRFDGFHHEPRHSVTSRWWPLR